MPTRLIKRRPCRVCHRSFLPAIHAGDRQHVCGNEACQREWHRRACAAWHRKNPDYDRETRVAGRIVKVVSGEERRRDPLASIDWAQVRVEVGLKVAMVMEEVGKVLAEGARETVRV